MGVGRVIPKFEGNKHSPFKTTEETRRDKMDKVDHPQLPKFPPPPQPVFEVKVNDNILGAKQPPQQAIYPATYVPVPNPLHPSTLYNPPAIGYAWTPNNVPVIKKYNVSINNAAGDLTRVAEIYEDILPPSAIAANRYTTLSERNVINNYVRSMIITKGDNEEIHMTGDKGRKDFELSNLMSRLKFMDINPYHFSRLTNNVYRTIPKNMVMFRTCYPIRFNSGSVQVKCADDSISMHVRIYSLSLFDKFVTLGISDYLKKTYSDVWREILYYEKIKEDVIKKKVCPNFVTMYAYFRTQNSGVNFQKMEELSGKYKNYNFDLIKDMNNVKNEMFYREVVLKTREIAKDLFVVWQNGRMPNALTNAEFQNKDETKKFLLDPKLDNAKVKSEQCIVAVTEGPTQNILNWATKTYQIDGPVRKQIQSGMYDEKVWKSVIFQLVVAMIVLEKQKIAFRDFSLENNVYIKDLNVESNSTSNIGYWKYRVNNVDYYVPNYGYLVMIDSRYPEFNMEEDDVVSLKFKPDHITQLVHYKIYGEMYGDEYEDINSGNIPGKLGLAGTELTAARTQLNTAKAALDAAKTKLTAFEPIFAITKQKYDDAKKEVGKVLSADLSDPTNIDTLRKTQGNLQSITKTYNDHVTRITRLQKTVNKKQLEYETALNDMSKKVVVNIDYNKKIQENILKVFEPNNFNKAFQLYGGVPPPAKIYELINKIYQKIAPAPAPTPAAAAAAAPPKLEDTLLENFHEYIHNKVGDVVLEDEKLQLLPYDANFVKGEVVALETSPNNYEWVVYLESSTNGAGMVNAKIIRRSNALPVKVTTETVTPDMLRRVYGTLKQKFNTNQKLSEEDLLDTYTVY